MVKTRRCSTACKMALAGMCTALCLESMLQCGLAVPAYAEEEMDGYTDSAEWNEFLEYWGGVVDDALNNYIASSDPATQSQYLTLVLAGNFAIANMQYQQNALALRADPNSGAIDYSVDIPAGSIYTGWYYRGGQPRSVTYFIYGTNGDAVICRSSVPVVSGDDFSISATVEPRQNIAYPGFTSSVYSGSVMRYVATAENYNYTLLFTGFTCSGIFASRDMTDDAAIFFNVGANSIITLDAVSYSVGDYVWASTAPYTLAGCLKNSSNQPISNSRQQFVRASVGNNFPDFLTNLKQGLDENFPEEVVNEIWYDPTQGEPLPDVGTLDSLNFPPGLPSASFNDVELPSEPLPAKMLSGAGFWFTSFSNMLDALGVKYIVITFLIIALIMAILKI